MINRKFKPVIFFAAIAAVGVVVMLLWNAIIPSIIGWGSLSYLQAVGLIILTRILFGGFGSVKEKFGKHSEHFRNRERLQKMSKAERKEYIREYMSNAEGNGQE